MPPDARSGTNQYRTNDRETTLAWLERAERERSSLLGRAMAWAARPGLVRSGGEAKHAYANVAALADAQGLLHLGAVEEHGHRREVWVDRTRVHQLHGSRPYFIVSYFDDASAVLTYASTRLHMPPAPALRVRAGTGSRLRDWTSHVAEAHAWGAQRRATALVVDDAETAARMVRHFYAVIAARSLLPRLLLARLLG